MIQPRPSPIEWARFRERTTPAQLRPADKRLRRLGDALGRRFGRRRVLGISLYFRHDQTPLWWFEQSALAVLAAAGWDVTWVTDMTFALDDARLAGLPGRVEILRVAPGEPGPLPSDGVDHVMSLHGTDHATRAAHDLGVSHIALSCTNIHLQLEPLQVPPAPDTPLWHPFAGSSNFQSGLSRFTENTPGWRPMGAPYPVCRAYMPLRGVPLRHDALVIGSNSRDHATVFAALAAAGVARVAALCNPDDQDRVRQLGAAAGLDIQTLGPQSHVDYVDLLEASRIVLNPILPPAESHSSMAAPMALGRPVIAHDLPSVAPYVGPGLRVVPVGDVAAWTGAIAAMLEETQTPGPHAGAYRQAARQHDMERFFASAIAGTLG